MAIAIKTYGRRPRKEVLAVGVERRADAIRFPYPNTSSYQIKDFADYTDAMELAGSSQIRDEEMAGFLISDF